MTAEQIRNRYNEGFGQGAHKTYRPWLQVHDVSSKGIAHRINGRKTGRTHVLLSNIERDAYLAAQWLDDVTDIREQYPLWPLEETIEIAADLGINHPALQGRPILMTSDLVLTTQRGAFQAIAVKPDKDLIDTRVLEKLEIERLYWEKREIDWHIVTRLEVPEEFSANLLWIDQYHEISPETVAAKDVVGIERHLFRKLQNASGALRDVCIEADDVLGRSAGVCLGIVRHAISRKRWRVPLDTRIDPANRLPPPILTARNAESTTLAT